MISLITRKFTNKPIARPIDFKREFNLVTEPVVDKQRSRVWIAPDNGRVSIRLIDSNDIIPKRHNHLVIEHIIATTPGKGHGNAALAMLTSLADEFNMTLGMFVTPMANKAMDREALTKWAEKHGFEEYSNPPDLFWRDPQPQV